MIKVGKSSFGNYAEVLENWLSETTWLSRNICPASHIEKHFGEDVFISLAQNTSFRQNLLNTVKD